MNAEPRLQQCLTFINCQLRPASSVKHPPTVENLWRAVTISRQTGSGAHAVAEELAKDLPALSRSDALPWTVFDRDLVAQVLEEHHLPPRLAKFMPEDRVSEIEDVIEDICGVHPLSSKLVDQTAETILRLAEMGRVILIGRGANIVTRKYKDIFHVRLVGSLEKRVEQFQMSQGEGHMAALDFVQLEDRGRARYMHKYFHQDIDDPLLYHLVINTDLISHKDAAGVIASTMVSVHPPVV